MSQAHQESFVIIITYLILLFSKSVDSHWLVGLTEVKIHTITRTYAELFIFHRLNSQALKIFQRPSETTSTLSGEIGSSIRK